MPNKTEQADTAMAATALTTTATVPKKNTTRKISIEEYRSKGPRE